MLRWPVVRGILAVSAAPLAAALALRAGAIGGPREALLVALVALPLAALVTWRVLGGGRPLPGGGHAEPWSLPSRAFHWLFALAILGTGALMFWMQGIVTDPDNAAQRADYREWLALHKSIGLVVLFLAPARMLWNMAVRRPPLLGVETLAQRSALAAVHATLYALMFVVPVAGALASQAYGGKAAFFGWFTLPQFVGRDEDLVNLLYPTHVYGSWILLGLVGLHAAAAVWHHAMKRDATLLRMLPDRR
ncbi:MAG: cytochrome b [Steroidobacteraceae bacterium]|nr:cytochrome b [Steroidobacteraceae bacterium]MCC7198239.1 cytochrome b [Gammaproteobacteria bacterium]